MKRSRPQNIPFALAVVFVLALPTHAYAYLVPGAGSYLCQILIATVLGAGVFWRDRIIGLFRWRRYKKPDPDQPVKSLFREAEGFHPTKTDPDKN